MDSTGDPAQGCSHTHHDHSAPNVPEASGDGEQKNEPAALPLPKWLVPRHIKYFLFHLVGAEKDGVKVAGLPEQYTAADTNRMTLAFFCVSALEIMGALDQVMDAQKKQQIIEWIYRQQVIVPPTGEFWQHAGFVGGPFLSVRGAVSEDQAGRESKDGEPTGEEALGVPASEHVFGHVAMTYTALATLAILGDDFSRVRRKDIVRAVDAMQREDGMFCATACGSEADMRFGYCAATIAHMLQHPLKGRDKAVQYILSSQTYDGSFPLLTSQEGHGGSAFCAVASLVLLDAVDSIPAAKRDELVQWCVLRQVGGFQGRRNKDPDTCYSFWVGATLQLLGEFELVDLPTNAMFHANCQFFKGGFSKFPSVFPDPLHSFFSTCFLAMKDQEGYSPINASLCISQRAYANAPWSKGTATAKQPPQSAQ